MKHRSSNKVHFENQCEDETIYSLEADDSLIEDNKIWFVILIMTLFSINYLYGSITNNLTTSNSTDNIFYW